MTGRRVQEMAKTDPLRQGDDPYQNGGQQHAKHEKNRTNQVATNFNLGSGGLVVNRIRTGKRVFRPIHGVPSCPAPIKALGFPC